MNIAYTSGPWKVINVGPHWNNVNIDNFEIQYGNDGECIVDHVYEQADANLIAAAPELYEALAKCLMVLSGNEMTKSALINAMESGRLAMEKVKGI